MDPKRECMVMREKDTERQFGELFMPRNRRGLVDIWDKLVTQETLEELGCDFEEKSNYRGCCKSKQGNAIFSHRVSIDNRKLTQMFAVYIYIHICGQGQRAVEGRINGRFLRDRLTDTINYFKAQHPNVAKSEFVGRGTIEIFISRVVFSPKYADKLSKNFQSIVWEVGQHAAGDEKLFHFTGDSPHVRLVPGKPGRVGHWHYELCILVLAGGKLLPFLVVTSIHLNDGTVVPTIHITGVWADAIDNMESNKIGVVKKLTYLVFDSYYTTSAVRSMLINRGQRFIGSVKHDRFNIETHKIHENGAPDKFGEWKSIYNDESGEVYTYHYDVQKGVGKKYCLSWGLERSTSKRLVKAHKDRIPAYHYYKHMFEVCDKFNRALHDRQWPHSRGGNNTQGDQGVHHDFLMAVILQNVFNAWFSVHDIDPASRTFESMCTELANSLYSRSVGL